MRNALIYILAGLLALACADDGFEVQQGGFQLVLTDDGGVDTRLTPAQVGKPVASRFNVRITNSLTHQDVYNGGFQEFVAAGYGDYTLVATCGADVALAIDAPYYCGTATATISAADSHPTVVIPCSVANSLLSVRYLDKDGSVSTARFDDYFSEYKVRTEIGERAVDLRKATQSAYFRAGTMPHISFVGRLKDTGDEVTYDISSSSALPGSLSAAQHLTISLSLEVKPAGVVLDIAKAEVENVVVSETIPLEWLPAPKMSAFQGETSFMRYEDEDAPANLVFNLATTTQVQDVEVTINSTYSLLSALNGTHLLSQMTDEQVNVLTDLGFTMPAIGTQYDGETFSLNTFATNLRTNDGAVTDNSIGIRVKANNRWSDVNTFTTQVKRLRITLPDQPDGNAWSKTIYINPVTAADIVAGEGVDAGEVLDNLQYEISSDSGETWTAVDATATGLNPGSTYLVRATYAKAPSLHSLNTASQITEVEADVPNGDFESLQITYNNRTIDQGGKYIRTLIGNAEGQNTQTFTVREPEGWGSTNAKTCNLSASTLNSWFCPLSVYNTSIVFQTNEAKIAGLGGSTIKPAIYCAQEAHNGNNAMVVRNVAYSANGTVPGTYKNTAATPGNSYYSKNTPSISDTAAGKLFLGTYSFVGGTETFNEGVDFGTRPTSISGYYKYDTSKGSSADRAKVTVTLLNGSTVIATGSADLGAAGDYTSFTVPITYSINSVKATSLRIMIASGQSDNVTTTKIAEYIQEAYGSVLCIDNLTFTYDN